MAVEQQGNRVSDPVLGIRQRQRYNQSEQMFSQILQQRLDDVLEARRNELPLMRLYPGQSGRLGIMATPAGFPRQQLRLSVARMLVDQTIDFVRADDHGGPVSQIAGADGSLFEVQAFSTKYPHIVIERTDHFVGDETIPAEITWSLRRVQNQRHQTEINRIIDGASLVVDLLKIVL